MKFIDTNGLQNFYTKIKERFIRTINGQSPDSSGNVEITRESLGVDDFIWEGLWTNEHPDQAYDGQDLSLQNLNEYKQFLIVFNQSNSDTTDYQRLVYCFKNRGEQVIEMTPILASVTGDVYIFKREILIQDFGQGLVIRFSDCEFIKLIYNLSTGIASVGRGGEGAGSNFFLIPYKIYGRKEFENS